MPTRPLCPLVIVVGLVFLAGIRPAAGQGFGTDNQTLLTPAAGGMAGTSAALPQDVPAAVFGNPASLTQFHGSQFTLGGAWVEGYPSLTHDGFLGGQAFTARSSTQGLVSPAIAVAQDLRSLGMPATIGLGLSGLSGIGAEFRGKAPANSFANDFSSEYIVLGLNVAAGVELTERLSLGASATLGTGMEQLGLVQSTAMVHDAGVRGSLGLDYALNECNTVGAYYQSKLGFQFPNAFRLPNGEYRNINIEQPDTFAFGYANRSLMDGDLLIAADVYYKLWEDAAMYEDVFVNQWALALGTQLTRGKTKYRLGYAYNSNPVNHNVGDRLNGFPVAQAELQFLQAANSAVINQHRLTAGIGREHFLVECLDLDLFAGGLFPASDEFGAHTQARVAVYYLGMGLTWKFGATRCCEEPAAAGEKP